MSAHPTPPRIVSRSDAAALVVFVLAGIGIAVWSLIGGIARIVEVVSRDDVPVFAEFRGTHAVAPIGPDGADVTVELDTAVIVAPNLPGVVTWSLVMEQAVLVATILTVVGTMLWLTLHILRGVVFSRTNTRLVTTAGLTGVIGFAAVPFFGNMGANGAFAQISDRDFDNVVMSVDLFPLILLAFLAGLGVLVFTVGERLQRETEGLV